MSSLLRSFICQFFVNTVSKRRSTVKLLNMAGKCFLCMTICDQTCSNGHYYCSEDHLRGHQSADQECYPFEIRESEVCIEWYRLWKFYPGGYENWSFKENKSSLHYSFYPWPWSINHIFSIRLFLIIFNILKTRNLKNYQRSLTFLFWVESLLICWFSTFESFRARTTVTQWRHKSKISEKLGRCGRQKCLGLT